MRAKRRVSRLAFAGLSGAGARGVDERVLGSAIVAVGSLPSVSRAMHGPVVRFLNGHEAIVRTRRGRKRVVSFTLMAVRSGGRFVPLDLSLKSVAGGFAPAAAVHPSVIGGTLSAGVSLPVAGVGLAMQGTDAQGVRVGRGQVFYGNVARDTDAIVAPTAKGVEMFATLRSRLSPELLSYDLSLPAGASLRVAGGGAEIVSGDRVLARVAPPAAVDAQGASVPVSLGVLGNVLTVQVAHRQRDVAYPILVDPELFPYEEAELGASSWRYVEGHWEGSEAIAPEENPFIGAFPGEIEGPLGAIYGAGGTVPIGVWEWTAPPGLWAKSVEFSYGATTSPEPAWIPFRYFFSFGCCTMHILSKQTGSGIITASPPTNVMYVGIELNGAFSKKEREEPSKYAGHIGIGAYLVIAQEGNPSEEFGTDNPADPNKKQACDGDPVNCANGNLVESQTDLSTGGRGLPLTLTRTYNSAGAKTEGAGSTFGYGWSATYNDHLRTSLGGILAGTLRPAVVTVFQANGSTATFTYGEGGYVAPPWVQAKLTGLTEGYTYTLPDQTVYRFSKGGWLVSESDRNGNTTTIKRNPEVEALIESVTDPAGRMLTYTYNFEDHVETVTDPMKHVVKFAYEGENLVSVTEPGETSPRWQYKYNAEHQMTEMIDGRGNAVKNGYESGRVVSQKDALGRETKWVYPVTEGERETTITEPNGSTTVEKFNERGEPLSITRATGTGQEAKTSFAYSAYKLTALTDPNKHVTKYEYNTAGDRTSAKNAIGDETKWTYNTTHDILTHTTPDGETTTIKRETHGNPETIERPAPGATTQITKYKYAANGDLESTEDPLKRITKYEYDSYGDKSAETDPEGNKQTWAYNEDSKETSTVSPRGHLEGAEPAKFTTTIERDTQGRPVLVTEPVSTGASKPVNRAAAGISGVAQEGQILGATAGVWEGTPTLSYGYQWQHCNAAGGECTAISGATESKYTLVHGDVGFTIRVAVTATGSAGSATSTSAATATVVAVVPVVLSQFGSAGTENGQFSAPRGAAITKNGNVLVLDTSNNRVEEFSQAGKYESKFGTLGSGNGQLKSPYGIAVDSKGNVWITDWGNNRVEEFNEKNEFLRTFGYGVTDAKAEFEVCTVSCKAGIAGTGTGQFKEPKGIAVTTAGRVYVSDAANNRIETFKEKGEFIATFGWGVTDAKTEYEVCTASCKAGLSGSGNGQFNGVRGVAVTPAGNLWVVESTNNRVQEFNEANAYVLKFGTAGTGSGQFKEPKGIAYTASGNVVVADEGNWRVESFSPTGTFITTFGTKGTGSGQFEEPSGIALAPNENMYVVDAKLNRVEQWEPIPFPAVYVAQFGSKGTGNGEFTEPHGAAIAVNGNLLVVDSTNNRVEEFSLAGKYEAKFGTVGSGNSQFKAPYGIAVDSKGNEWVTDTVNNRVEEFNEKNEFIRTIGWGVTDAKSEFEICTASCKAGIAGSGAGQLKEPRGIAVNAAGNVYVSEGPNNRVDIFKEKGEFISTFGWGVTDAKSELETCTTACKTGLSGSGNGQFSGVRGVAVSPAGSVWVVESTNNRVQEFNTTNEYVLKFGASGTGTGQFKEPKGIAYTAGGNVLVADEGNARVQSFTQTGAFLSTFGTKGTGAGQLEEPSGLTVASNENAYVVDFKNNRVQQWRPAGLPSSTALPAISGQLLVGQTLTASTGTWSASPSTGYAYQWQRCNRAGGECSSISGATSSTHVLVTADTAKTLRIVVTATNSAGSAEATSPASEPTQGARTTEYTYDANGNGEIVTDANANKTKYTYNADNEPTKTEEPNGTTTETGYDSEGQITSQTDGNKHTTEYTRNLLERVTEVIDPLKRKTLKEYDLAGNLTKLTEPLKRVTTNTYNEANQLTETSYSDGITHAVKYEYNGDGLPTKMTDGTGETITTYDQLDRITNTEDGHKDKTGYEYDLDNEQTKITYPNTKAITRAFDKDGRLEKVTDWLTNATKFTYDADSNLTATIFPGNEDKYTYNEAGQLTEIKMSKGAETLATLGYTRDNNGQVKSSTQTGLPGEATSLYEYDPNNRLTMAISASYEYDAANNATKQGTNSYAFDAASELETGPGTTKYAYNEQGQRTKTTPTTGPATTYGYNQAENLTTITRPEEGATPKIEDSYGYDGSGLRASQTISGTTTYMTWNTTEQIPLLLNDTTNNYILGPEGAPIESIASGGTVLYLHRDQAGSTRMLTSSTGAKEASFTYDAYGNQTGHTGTATTPLGFDAQYTSSDTGLIYLRARVYDPATGQFLSVDPAEQITRAPYNYAGDNPVNSGDPTGLCNANPFSESFWTKGNCVSESPLNPIPYYEAEIESYENGCGYWASVAHGLEGAVAGAALFAGGEGADEADIVASDVLKGKLGKITRAPLPPGSPAWADIANMTMAEIRVAAKANEPGFKVIYKLLNDSRFDKP
jgi:tripartite motif-containing protein 71